MAFLSSADVGEECDLLVTAGERVYEIRKVLGSVVIEIFKMRRSGSDDPEGVLRHSEGARCRDKRSR